MADDVEDPKGSRSRERCADCGVTAPATGTNYTLISPSHGWRLTREVIDGKNVMRWRCASCFARRREKLRQTGGGQ